MRYVILIIFAMMLGGAVENAEASNAGAARERMTASLLAEPGFEQGGYGHGYQRQLLMKEGDRWVPVQLAVKCSSSSCVGRVLAEEAGTTVLEDHARFTGRKGTYHETGWTEPKEPQ